MAVTEPVLDTIYITAFALSPAEEQIRQKVAEHARTAGFQVAPGPDPRFQRGAGGFVDPLKVAWQVATRLVKIYIWVRKTLEQRATTWRENLRPTCRFIIDMNDSQRETSDFLILLPDILHSLRQDFPMFNYRFDFNYTRKACNPGFLVFPGQVVSNRNVQKTHKALSKRPDTPIFIYWQVKQSLFGQWKGRMRTAEQQDKFDRWMCPPVPESPHQILKFNLPSRWR